MFGGLKGLGDIAKLMPQMQEMQRKMAELQSALELAEVEGYAAEGKIAARVSGKGKMVGLTIHEDFRGSDELPELIVDAVRDAQDKADEMAKAEMQKIVGDMPIPQGMLPQ